VLLDTGTEGEFLWRVKPFLAACGINRLDALMVSHPDADHAGGTALCLAYFQPAQVIYAGFDDAKGKDFEAQLRSFPGRHRSLYRGETVAWGPGLAARVLWPPRFEGEGEARPRAVYRRPRSRAAPFPLPFGPDTSRSNEHSLIVLWEFPGGNALFTGDATAADEYWGAGFTRVRLLKVAHHGSQSSSGEAFLARAAPELAVVQPGFFGVHHFPHPAVWARLQRYAATALDTARTGAVQATFSPDGSLRYRGWK
jgi:competence protein ComEC